MAGRVFAGVVVAFWLVMMGALVRVEFFPKALGAHDVPIERVLEDIFANEAPARLNVYYRGEKLGFCNVYVTPLYKPEDRRRAGAATKPSAYLVNTDLQLEPGAFGMAGGLGLRGNNVFNPRYEIEKLDIVATVGDNFVKVVGSERTRKVTIDYLLRDKRGKHELDFSNSQGAGLANAVGLPGLAGFNFLGSGSGEGFSKEPVTRTHLEMLTIGGERVETYVVESNFDDTTWVKMWVSKNGEILTIDTSLQLTMKSVAIETQESAPARKRPRPVIRMPRE